MAESYVVSALVAKRAESAGVIAQTERRLNQFCADLVHLDAALRGFAPKLNTISARKILQSDLWFEERRATPPARPASPGERVYPRQTKRRLRLNCRLLNPRRTLMNRLNAVSGEGRSGRLGPLSARTSQIDADQGHERQPGEKAPTPALSVRLRRYPLGLLIASTRCSRS